MKDRRKSSPASSTPSNSTSSAPNTSPSPKPSDSKQETPSKPLPDCLNPACSQKHFVRDCPNTDTELRAKLLSEYRKRKKEGTINILSTPDFTSDSPLPHGRLRGSFSDKVPVVINGDYGADFASISERHLQTCHAHGLFVPTQHLNVPVTATLAFKNDGSNDTPKVFSSNKKVRLTVTLETPAGPLRLRNVEFVVFKEQMSEVLLSRPLLQTLGLDVDKHLSTVREVS